MIIDIVIPTLNEAYNLQNLLSYLKSCVPNSFIKIIVVDSSKSNDNSEAICKHNDAIYIRSNISQRAHQMNLGAMKSSADAIMFLHADVRPPRSFYSLISKSLIKYDCGMFAYRFDKRGVMFSFNAFFTQFDGFFTGGGDQCFFIKRETFIELGKYDESYQVMEDFEFFRRVKKSETTYEILSDRAIVSSRKYEKHSYIRINWVNLRMLIAFYRSEKPSTLWTRYVSFRLN